MGGTDIVVSVLLVVFVDSATVVYVLGVSPVVAVLSLHEHKPNTNNVYNNNIFFLINHQTFLFIYFDYKFFSLNKP